ncbi:MAG TPA: NUDIX hydrolase [Rhodothermales bacterium]|nr:NUDIX hydrolase [Rhodothermales bacterium]
MSETLKSRTLVYDGVMLKVNRDTVEVDDGTERVREWVAHPGAAAVVPIYPDGSTVLVRQFRYATGRSFLEVPAGKLDVEGEDPAEAACRELEEEAGVRAETITALGATWPCIGYSNEVIHLFLAEGLTEGKSMDDPGERVEVVRMPFTEAVRMAQAGELDDAKTVVALLRAAAWLEGRGA